MAESTFLSLFAVHQATSDIEAQVDFYKQWGFIVDRGYDALEAVPDEFYTARGMQPKDLRKVVCLRNPGDPFMHLILYDWENLTRGPAWPAPFNQIGSRGFSIIVEDLDKEVQRIKKDFPKIKFLTEKVEVQRRWGLTKSAVFVDLEDIQVELLEIEKGSQYDRRKIHAPRFNDMQWLHFMVNCWNYKESMEFYQAFNLSHDAQVDFRKDVGFHPFGQEHYKKVWRDAYNLEQSDLTGVGFLRHDQDPSAMHLELMDWNHDALITPGDKPTWQQRGIARCCFRVENYEAALQEQRLRGTRLYTPDQRGCLYWGDTQWFDAGDVDGNVITKEQWHPIRFWGARS